MELEIKCKCGAVHDITPMFSFIYEQIEKEIDIILKKIKKDAEKSYKA